MKQIWIKHLRVLGIVAVIITHVSACLLYKYDNPINFYWWTGLLFAGTARFCVPIFLMISGALLLTKEYTFTVFLEKGSLVYSSHLSSGVLFISLLMYFGLTN